MAATIKSCKQRLAKNIKKTAKELDKVLPGWYRLIDTDILDMNLPNKCICGQLKSKGFFRDIIAVDDSADYGFWLFKPELKKPKSFTTGTGEAVNGEARKFLKDTWISEIESRLCVVT